MTDPHPLIKAVQPVVDAVGATIVPAAEREPSDVPLEWEGETVAANAPLLRIVELDPVTAVFFVTERDYAQLQTGQRAVLSTDAFPRAHDKFA